MLVDVDCTVGGVCCAVCGVYYLTHSPTHSSPVLRPHHVQDTASLTVTDTSPRLEWPTAAVGSLHAATVPITPPNQPLYLHVGLHVLCSCPFQPHRRVLISRDKWPRFVSFEPRLTRVYLTCTIYSDIFNQPASRALLALHPIAQHAQHIYPPAKRLRLLHNRCLRTRRLHCCDRL